MMIHLYKNQKSLSPALTNMRNIGGFFNSKTICENEFVIMTFDNNNDNENIFI